MSALEFGDIYRQCLLDSENNNMPFPKNPKTGDTVVVEDGLTYVYDGTLHIWHQQEGGTISLATPLISGLMSSADLKKLNGLVVPPPQATISVADYDYAFTSGTIALMEGDEFVQIDSDAKISNISSISRQIHQNTYAFNFTVDTNAFFQYMVDSGRFVVRSPRGPQGDKGNTGVRGQDNLPYGPDGPIGDNGANAPSSITVQPEPASLERVNQSVTRAVTAIATEEVSETENYLVVTRSIIGNPEACPSQLKLSSTANSNWLIALPNSVSQAIITWLPETCYSNSQQVYYIDVSSILGAIEAEFNREVVAIKSDCENIVQFWLSVMAGLFDEQKAALCCALEYCQSQSRNAETRKYIEEQRIQAAQAITLKGSSSTSVSFTDPATGHLTTVSNEAIQSTAQSIVIDGNPRQSGKSVVNTTIMDQACGTGFGAKNIHNLPNNQDPVGGSPCVTGIILSSDGKALKYDECPPGFIPRYVERDAVLTSSAAAVPVHDYPADYNVALDIPETGSGTSQVSQGTIYGKVTPGVNLYLPPGVSLARKLAVNAFRSNNPATSSELRVTVTGSPLSLCKSVIVYVKSTGGTILAYGQTNSDGDIYFKNLSSLEQYNISLEKSGCLFAPPNWSLIQPVTLQITQLQSTVTTGVATTPIQQIVKCSSGSNVLVVTVRGDAEGINSTWVSIRYYTTGYTLCAAYAGTSTTNQGEIVFTGIPDGLWVVYAGTDETSETDPNYYEVDQPCHPVANPVSQQAMELRSCRTVQFVHRTDGSQNLARMSFDVLTKAKPTSSWVLSSSIPAELIMPGDARFETLVKQQILADPNADISLSEAMSAFEISEPVVLKIESDADFDVFYTDRFGTDYHDNLGMMTSKDGAFFDKLFNGVYNICIVNKSRKLSKFDLSIATQNVKFLQGAGDGWSGTLIQTDNSIKATQGPTEAWWLQMRIEHPQRLQQPYSSSCGAIGPRSSKTDRRFCRELPNGSGSVLTRDFAIGDGSLSIWYTSRCGTNPVPDAVAITVGSPFAINDLILCRVAPNAYSGGFNIGPEKRSVQIIIEQLEPVEVVPDQMTDVVGGNSYRCTLLGWNTNDCIGDVSNFGSVIITANCNDWSLNGAWIMAGVEVKFNVKAVENLTKDVAVELTLDVDESNPGFFKLASAELPKGEYVVDIIDCCFRSGEQYTGHVEIEYQSTSGKVVKRFPNLGAYIDDDTARSNYRGLTIEIDHQGGAVDAKLVSPVLLDGSGKVSVRFTEKDSFVQNEPQGYQLEDTCAISYAQVKMLEGWHLSEHNGILVDLAGQDYIIMQQYIDGMQACVEKYGHPSFAWPTLDGMHFTNIPESGIVLFKRIPQLEAIAKSAIKGVNIDIILFPIIA
jgi:hypothetical protein